MIENQLHRVTTREQIELLREALAAAELAPGDDEFLKLHIAHLRYDIRALEAEAEAEETRWKKADANEGLERAG